VYNRDIDWLLDTESERNGSYLTEQNAQATIANNKGNTSRDKNILAKFRTQVLMTAKDQQAVALSTFHCINCYKLEWQ
jgi:hypothetical protein